MIIDLRNFSRLHEPIAVPHLLNVHLAPNINTT